jgi:hypothetical protein
MFLLNRTYIKKSLSISNSVHTVIGGFHNLYAKPCKIHAFFPPDTSGESSLLNSVVIKNNVYFYYSVCARRTGTSTRKD